MAGARAARGPVLPRDPRLRRVLVAYGCSAITEFATWLTILLVAYDKGGATWAGAASVAMLLPSIVLVPVLAGFGDRMPRGRALSLTYAAEAAGAALVGAVILAGAPLWLVVLGGIVLTLPVSLVRPMHFAAIPLLARRPADLVAANGLSTVLDGAALFVGFAISGLLTGVLGAWVVMACCALLAVVAALLTRGLGLPVAAVEDGDGPEEIRAALAGLRALRGSAGAIALLLLMAGVAVVEGAEDTLTVAFNDQVLGSTATTAGVLAGANGLGLAIGGATLASLAHRRRLAPLVLAGALLLGAAELSVAMLGALAPAVIVLLLGGVGASIVLVSARTLLQRSIDDHVLARVLAIQEGAMLTGLAIGAGIAPVLVLWLGPARAFIPLGLLLAAGALLAFPLVRALEATSHPHLREVAILRGVPFLAGLAPYELERLAQASTWQHVAPGTAVIQQGEPGDAFHVVVEGHLQVSVDGVPRPGQLGPGDGFGEIALVLRVPRTATVTATTPVELLTVSAAAFLAAVTSSVTGQELARSTAEDRRAGDPGGR
ncbi:MAG TPA: MFS transporter [Candidatus Nanopelagicales bacterium]